MKNYELISRLMKLPAGYEITFGKMVKKEQFEDENEIYIEGTAEEIDVSNTHEEIHLIIKGG